MLTSIYAGADFYPRPPRGGRLMNESFNAEDIIFLSTPSARRATCGVVLGLKYIKISIHALREEGDAFGDTFKCRGNRFLSTPSARRATGTTPRGATPRWEFLSTPSARRATRMAQSTSRL